LVDYEIRLQKLGLTKLIKREKRQFRGDLIETFKIPSQVKSSSRLRKSAELRNMRV